MKVHLTPLGAVVIVVFAAGAVLFVVSSGVAAAIGGLVALLAIAFVVADQLPAGLGGNFVIGRNRRPSRDQRAPEPEYIERAGSPSEAVWRHEQELYDEKESRRAGGAARRPDRRGFG